MNFFDSMDAVDAADNLRKFANDQQKKIKRVKELKPRESPDMQEEYLGYINSGEDIVKQLTITADKITDLVGDSHSIWDDVFKELINLSDYFHKLESLHSNAVNTIEKGMLSEYRQVISVLDDFIIDLDKFRKLK